MIRRPPRSTRTDTLFPYTTLFRSCSKASRAECWVISGRNMLRKPDVGVPECRTAPLISTVGDASRLRRSLFTTMTAAAPSPDGQHCSSVDGWAIIREETNTSALDRSEENSVGKEGVRTWKSRWSPYEEKK